MVKRGLRSTSMQNNELENPGAIARLIAWSVNNQLLVALFVVTLLVAGIQALKEMPLDAIPDMSDTQVIIRTDFAGQAPEIVEDLVTYPLSTTMLGLPRSKAVRGFSMFGTSFVYIIFEDGVDQYWARSRVVEALSKIGAELPQTARPQIGPDATGVGWVYQYALVDNNRRHDLAQLRSLQDWFLRYELATVDGVAEVASVGGFVKEYQILVDPNRLRAFDVPLMRLLEAVRKASIEAGGRVLERGETEYIIRSKGYVEKLEDLQNIVLYSRNSIPVLLTDVARVLEGPELRRGVTELDGEGEVVAGIVVMRAGENALNVIRGIEKKLDELRRGLPEGVEIVPVYNRAPLIEGSISYLQHKLLEEGMVVALVCLVFLLHARSALVAIINLPLAILAAFIVMTAQGITANIMSLGGIAIAIGAMVDASIVMVENAHRKLSGLSGSTDRQEKSAAILRAAQEVGPGLFFSLLIITVSFLPVFALTGQSYKLFSPLAYTKTYSMAFAALFSVTVVPMLMLWLIRGRIRREDENLINRFFIFLYRPLLVLALKWKWVTIICALLMLFSMVYPASKTGSEFMPALYEGELLYMPTTLPGVSITKAKEILQKTNHLIKSIPEVEMVFGKLGRAETATDPAPVSMIESWIRLKAKKDWREGLTKEKLIKELDKRVKLPGLVNSWGYPIKIRMDMISTGIRTPIGIKITGDDLETINRLALSVESAVKKIDGTRSVFADRVTGGKYLEIIPDRQKIARYSIDLATVQSIIGTALGGNRVSEAVQGRERYNIIVRYDRPFREDFDDLENILVPTPMGQHIPLGELATIQFVEGPPMIKSENARLTGWVFVDIDGRDIGSYVDEAKTIVAESVSLPSGYSLIWSGQFQQMQEAEERMRMAVPATILIIFTLLMLHFGRLDRTMMIMLSLPFGLTGGVWAVHLAGYYFSVAVGVGFIALAGIAVETGVVMLLYIDQQVLESKPTNRNDLLKAIIAGAALRVRPKLMTVATTMVGLTPIFITEGLGSDVMRRIALPMIGGMASTTLLTLFMVPVVYFIWEAGKLKKSEG
ncbi:MAG: efflux RND transporter permease subunit [Desulfobulbaceae bacterium]|nr:efflux RND transporter permease subunit [Desulfobulbaceae bacterium]